MILQDKIGRRIRLTIGINRYIVWHHIALPCNLRYITITSSSSLSVCLLYCVVQLICNAKVCTILTSLWLMCHDRDRTHPYTPCPDLSTPIPSRLNHSRAPNTKPEPSDPLASQQRTPEHSDSLASSQRIPNPTHPRPFLSLASSRFPTTTLIPDPTSFDLLSSCVSPIPDVHQSRDCGRAKPDRVPPSLDAS